MLSNILKPNTCYLKIIGHTLKSKQNNKCVCIHKVMRLIMMEMKMKKETRSHRYDINRHRSRHRHKYKVNIKLVLV